MLRQPLQLLGTHHRCSDCALPEVAQLMRVLCLTSYTNEVRCELQKHAETALKASAHAFCPQGSWDLSDVAA